MLPDTAKWRQTVSPWTIAAGIASLSLCLLVAGSMLRTRWMVRTQPIAHWYHSPHAWALVATALVLSFLVAYTVENRQRLRQVSERFERLLVTDPLTGLLNRTGLFQALEELCRKQAKVQLWYVDINYFKRINDSFGQRIGDRILVNFARNVRQHLGEGPLFARVGGDEFVIISTDAYLDGFGAECTWEAVENSCEAPIFYIGGDPIYLTFSRGMARMPEDADNPEDLIAIAGREMHMAKTLRYAVEKKRRFTDTVRFEA